MSLTRQGSAGGDLPGGRSAHAGGTLDPRRSADSGGTLVVVAEPPSATSGVAGRTVLSEGERLAARLGMKARFITWLDQGAMCAEQAARGLAEAATKCQAALVLLADTDLGREVAPLLALLLGGDAILGCSDILVKEERPGVGSASRRVPVFVKPVYGGWLEQDLQAVDGQVVVATLAVEGLEEPAEAITLPEPEPIEILPAAEPRVRRLELIPPDPRSVDLVHARKVVTAGLGAADEDLLQAVRELADLLESSLGATRPVVDDGWLSKERLIGQTGRTVTPKLYLALGVSGSPHHLAGVRKAQRILSVNRDPRAPIFQFSDVGYVADLRLVLPLLTRKIKEWRDGGAEQL